MSFVIKCKRFQGKAISVNIQDLILTPNPLSTSHIKWYVALIPKIEVMLDSEQHEQRKTLFVAKTPKLGCCMIMIKSVICYYSDIQRMQ